MKFFDCDTVPKVWFICGYTVATMQRQAIMKEEDFFPQLNVFGDGPTTIAAKVGASLIGMHNDRDIITEFKDATAYNQVSKLSGIVQLIDDPAIYATQGSKDAIDDFIWSMSIGATRRVRGKEPLTPKTNCIIISTQPLDGDNPAIGPRLIKLHIPKNPVDTSALPAIEDAMSQAIGGLEQLLAIQYDRSACQEIERKLLKHLTGGDRRTASSIALITYFTQKFCDASGIDFSAFDYAATHLCPTYND